MNRRAVDERRDQPEREGPARRLGLPASTGHLFASAFDQTFQFASLLKPNGTVVAINQTALDSIGQDKVDSFRLGVAGYMLKPVDYHQFVEVVKTLDLYWTLSELSE